ncbi:transcriptional repressor [Natroniella acetigena]|uniref:Fur family transcriptional regulator n=1 Tax=Natroniella acetigena TaxID=52004 RepID=UPI00200B3BB8|nr:Fur family transcriptional regulator [Natroniella acetigena]MCK8826502.1 transcriptional repressor [Natroniella acetigena]
MDELMLWKEKLKEKGIRWTKQRAALLRVLLQIKRPLSAQEIFLELETEGVDLRLSTVYRNLNCFKSNGIVKNFNFDEQENKFELIKGEHHHHLICINCEEVKPLDCPLQEFEAEVDQETDYAILEHRMKMYGICPNCQKDTAD